MVIATSDLRELARFTAERALVVSLYLDTDLSRQLKDQVKLVLRDLLERAEAAEATGEDLERISRYVDLEYDWQGRGLIVFSGRADGLWEPFPLPVPVKSQVFVGDKVYLMPLSNLLDQYAPYGVGLVDKEQARLFLIDMGGVVREENVTGEPIKRQKQGGWSATRWQRHEDRLAFNNLKAAAEALARFCSDNDCSRVILAGTDENTARFRGLLPTSLRQTVVGTMPLDMTASGTAVVERSREILDELEEQQEDELVQRMITVSAKGGPAVTGLADTLFTLHEGRVLTMLVEEGFSAPGFFCPGCDYLYVDEMQHCLFCGTAEARRVRNVVERAAHRAFLLGAKVEIIEDNPDLARVGHIGALLRY